MSDNPEPPPAPKKAPAILSLVEMKWLEQAFDEFRGGKPEIWFVADAMQLSPAIRLEKEIKKVYFKITGGTDIRARAAFTGISTDNKPDKRLKGFENETGKFYYGFRELTWLPRIPLSSLRYSETGTTVRNDTAGSCVIEEPDERQA